jgi:hypothetical protein
MDFTPHDPEPCPETGHGDRRSSVMAICPQDDNPATQLRKSDTADPWSRVRIFPDPCPENAESRVRNPDTNLVREPLSKPVKEEEGAQACAAISDQFFGEVLLALGLDPAALPGWWQGWPPRLHVQRWRDELGLTEAEIVAAAEASRQEHPEPPDGPKALDRAMQRAAQRKVEDAGTETPQAQGELAPAAKPITDLPAFYAKIVNADGYLPVSAISNTMRDAMLARGWLRPNACASGCSMTLQRPISQ